jgi:hypothetical protein
VGFDLIGIRARNKKGEYFRNNIWWWPRLWEFCCDVTPELTDSDRRIGHHNDGLRVIGMKHGSLVKKLEDVVRNRDDYERLVCSGKNVCRDRKLVVAKITEVIKELVSDGDKVNEVWPKESNYHFDWGNVERFLCFIKNNEGFEIW